MIKRVWTLGNIEHKLFPTSEAVAKLRELINSDEEDIIWGPDLTVTVLDGTDMVLTPVETKDGRIVMAVNVKE